MAPKTVYLSLLLLIGLLVVQMKIKGTTGYPSEIPITEEEYQRTTQSDDLFKKEIVTETTFAPVTDEEKLLEIEQQTTLAPLLEDFEGSGSVQDSDKRNEEYLQRALHPEAFEDDGSQSDIAGDNASVSSSEPESRTDGKGQEGGDCDEPNHDFEHIPTDSPLIRDAGPGNSVLEDEVGTESLNGNETLVASNRQNENDEVEVVTVAAVPKTQAGDATEVEETTQATPLEDGASGNDTVDGITGADAPVVTNEEEETDKDAKSDQAEPDGQVERFVDHGGSYAIMAISDDNLALTSTKHKYLQSGLLPGKVKLEEFSYESTQIFDTILMVDGNDPLFWITSMKYSMNHLNMLKVNKTDSLVKNLMRFIPVENNEYRNTFLMESQTLQKCVEHQGEHYSIVYTECNQNSIKQQFRARFLYEDKKIIK